MLGGGYVRRRSIGSAIEASPCMRVEKRRPKGTLGHALARIPSGDAYDFGEEIHSSVIKYYFALGKTNKWASSAACFVIVLRALLGVSGD